MRNMLSETILGSWLLVGSEVSSLQLGTEIFHFRAKGRLDIECKSNALNSSITKCFFKIQDDMVMYSNYRRESGSILKVHIESGHLVCLGNDGMESWFKKLDYGYFPLWSYLNKSNYA